jgi:predicted nucleic acid-binding protein
MNVVDSSAWLAWFAGEQNAEQFEKAITDTNNLIVPVLCVYEVFKVLLRETNETDALKAITLLQQGRVVDLDTETALNAAKLSFEKSLPMADAIIYTIAEKYRATLWTQDADFEGLSGVKYFPKAV